MGTVVGYSKAGSDSTIYPSVATLADLLTLNVATGTIVAIRAYNLNVSGASFYHSSSLWVYGHSGSPTQWQPVAGTNVQLAGTTTLDDVASAADAFAQTAFNNNTKIVFAYSTLFLDTNGLAVRRNSGAWYPVTRDMGWQVAITSNSVNWNTLRPDVYRIGISGSFSGNNAPSGAYTYGTLIVFRNQNSITQIYAADGRATFYMRTVWNGASAWNANAWAQYSGTSVAVA